MGITLSQDEYDTAVKQVLRLLDELRDAKEYGSILTVTPCDWDLLRRFAVPRTEDEGGQQLLGIHGEQIAAPLLQRLINIGEALSQQYDVVVTNPPYMGASGMNARLSQYIKDHFPDTKADLFACFIERGNQMAVKHGYNCMVTMQSWMFLSSFEKMREKILRTKSITNLMHMENMVMGIAFGTAVTVFRNDYVTGYKGTYNQIKLQDIENDEPRVFPVLENRLAQTSTDNFSKIPGSPVAYWVSDNLVSAFASGIRFKEVGDTRQGMATSDVNRFTRYWYEPSFASIGWDYTDLGTTENGLHTWFPYIKGGSFRKWYGNEEYLVNWKYNGRDVKQYAAKLYKSYSRTIKNISEYLKPCISWGMVTSGDISVRFYPAGQIFDIAGCCCFSKDDVRLYLLAFMNSKVANVCTKIINPTINMNVGDIANLPLLIDMSKKTEIDISTDICISISKSDWDSYETSWDFKRNPLV